MKNAHIRPHIHSAHRNLWVFLLTAACCFFSAPTAAKPIENATASIRVSGKKYEFTLPPNYCPFGSSAAETKLLKLMEIPAGTSSIENPVVFAAAPCESLKKLAKGEIQDLDFWMTIRVMKTRVRKKLDDFLTEIAGVSEAADHAELEQRFKDALKNTRDYEAHKAISAPVGRDDLSFYLSMNSELSIGRDRRFIAGLVAITLLNRTPISVAAYEGAQTLPGGSGLQSTARKVVISLHGQ